MKNITTNNIMKKPKKNLSKLMLKKDMQKIMNGNIMSSMMNLITTKPKVAIVVQSIIKTKGIDLRMRLTGIWTRHNNTRGAWKLKESIYRNPYSPAIITNNNTNINTIKINTEAFQYYLALKS